MSWSPLKTLKRIEPCTYQQWWDTCMEDIRIGGGAMFTYDLDSVLDDLLADGCITYVWQTENLCITKGIRKRLAARKIKYAKEAAEEERRENQRKADFLEWVEGIQLDTIKSKLRHYLKEGEWEDGYQVWVTLWDLLE